LNFSGKYHEDDALCMPSQREVRDSQRASGQFKKQPDIKKLLLGSGLTNSQRNLCLVLNTVSSKGGKQNAVNQNGQNQLLSLRNSREQLMKASPIKPVSKTGKSSRLAFADGLMGSGELFGGQSKTVDADESFLLENSVIHDPETGDHKVNPKYRRT